MAVCPYCHKTIPPQAQGTCPVCMPLYQEALRTKNFPKPITQIGWILSMSHWSWVARERVRLANLGKTEEEIDAEINDWAERYVASQREILNRQSKNQKDPLVEQMKHQYGE